MKDVNTYNFTHIVFLYIKWKLLCSATGPTMPKLALSHWCWKRDAHLGTAATRQGFVKVNCLTRFHTQVTIGSVPALKEQLISLSYTSHELVCSEPILSYVTWRRYFTRHAQLTHKRVPKGCLEREESQTSSSIKSVRTLPQPYKILMWTITWFSIYRSPLTKYFHQPAESARRFLSRLQEKPSHKHPARMFQWHHTTETPALPYSISYLPSPSLSPNIVSLGLPLPSQHQR